MLLNPLGELAKSYWQEIPKHYANVSLDEHIVMPNHLHGIIIIGQADGLHYSLSQIIGSYKNVVSKELRKITTAFAWQPSFYDHVIRKDKSLNKIREYICNNPAKWDLDRNNPSNIWM